MSRFRHLTGHVVKAIIMPDDVAYEKVKALEALGAGVERVRPASIVDKKQASLVVLFLDFSTFTGLPLFVVCGKCAVAA
jgi:hypothetical protein